MAGSGVVTGSVGSEIVTNVGLSMTGYFIQLSAREFTDKDTGAKKQKYYLMMAVGQTGAVNVGISAEEYAAVAQKGLSMGALLMVPVEAFAFRDRAYFRAIGPATEVVGV